MIVLPNSYERYLASLRIFVLLSVLKYGLEYKHLKKLKKITAAEAFYNKNTVQNVDIYKLCKNLLSAVKSVKPAFNFRVTPTKAHCINKLLLSLFLLTIAQHGKGCEIYTDQNNIIIKTTLTPKPLSALLSALGGYSFFERKCDRSLFVLPAPETNEPPVFIESEWEYIFDKFSLLNIFFENIQFG